MKKIAHLCTTSLSHKILVDKLSLLKKKGYDIHLISSKEGYNEELINKYDFNLRFVNMSRNINIISDTISILRLVTLFRKEKYEIVHTHTAKAGLIGRIAAKIARVPIVIHTSHGLPFYEGQGKLKYCMYSFFEKIGGYFSDALASQNKEDIYKLKKIAPKKEVWYEGNGVDIVTLDNIRNELNKEDILRLRSDLNIKGSKKVILVGARFEPVKDHFFLLEGLKGLREKTDDFICLLAGQGELESNIKSKIIEYQLEEHVKIIGQQTNIYPFIEMSDIVALTSEKEGIPRIIMEAMAYRKPVVASNVMGTRELVVDNKTGILVEYKNVKDLSDALHLLLRDNELREKFGIEGRRIIESEFTEEIVASRIDNFYKKVE